MRSALLVEPDHHTAPAYERTLGPEVADLCEQVGYAPYPEQRLLLDDAFALDPVAPNRSAAFEVAAVVARQNLKTGFFKQATLGWLFITDVPLVVWSAHEFRTAQESFRDFDVLLSGSSMLSKRVKRVYRGNGDESIELLSGNRLIFKARTSGGGRGLTGDRVVLDEAYALRPEHMGALLPTLLAVPDPQVVYGSSAGMVSSEILRSVRDRGRPGAARLAYAEWLAPRRACAVDPCTHVVGTPGCALDDRSLWAHANPVHARRDPSLTALAALRGSLPPGEFARECLGWWDDPVDGAAGDLVSMSAWAAREDPSSRVPGTPTFGVALAADRSTASVGVAGKSDAGRLHVEVVESHALQAPWDGAGRGVAGLVSMLGRLCRENGAQVVLDAKGPAGELVGPLIAANVRTHVVTSEEFLAACVLFVDAVEDGRLAHLGDAGLTGSVAGAWRRMVGDRIGLDRKKSDASQVESVVMASHGVDLGGLPFNIW